MSTKKYVSLSRLSTFLDNLNDKFAALTHKHTISDLTDLSIDTELSSTSTNPVQNKVLDAEFDAIGDAMSALELAIDNKSDVGHTHTKSEIADLTEQVQSDWSEDNETSPAFIKNKPTEEDAMELISELGLIEPVIAEDGSIYIDENGAIYSII